MRFCLTLFLTIITHYLAGQHPDLRPVNSTYDEQNPVLSPDGRTLFFTIGNHPANVGGKKDPGDIWISRLTNGVWSAPEHGGSTLNNRAYNAVAGVSPNGDLYLHGHYTTAGEPARSQGISLARRTAVGWSRPSNISIPYYQNRSAILSGALSGDGTIFVFAAETYGTLGVEDIYVSFFRDGKWSEPLNLGPSINTQFQELSPSLSNDARTLYFSSNGRKGQGSFDVFQAHRTGENWTEWTTPVPVEGSLNSSGRELYFRPHATYAVYATTLNSDGYGDIRLYRWPESLPALDSAIVMESPVPVDTLIEIVETMHNTADTMDEHSVNIYGKVVNAKTGENISGRVMFAGPRGDTLLADVDTDGYEVSVPSSAQYRIVVEAAGFISTMQTLDIDTYEMQDLEMNFTLQPAEVGTTVNLKNVLFAQSRTDILPESHAELDLVVRFLKANPSVRIELSGHTDGRGVAADNLKLSQARVDRVKDYLVSKGIEPRRITGKGYGGTRPIAGNDTEESRRLNRRVEFTIKRS